MQMIAGVKHVGAAHVITEQGLALGSTCNAVQVKNELLVWAYQQSGYTCHRNTHKRSDCDEGRKLELCSVTRRQICRSTRPSAALHWFQF